MKYLYLLSILFIIIGVSLFFVQIDREYINLIPTEGMSNGVILDSDTTYEQVFPATRKSLACVGIFLRPTVKSIPNESISLTLRKADRILSQQTISAPFIDSEGASRVCFDPPIPTTIGQEIRLQVSIPATLNNTIRLQQRLVDDSFNPDTVRFLVNSEIQKNPAAYQASYDYRPPLSLQLGGLLVLAGILFLIHHLSFSKERSAKGRVMFWSETAIFFATSLLFTTPALILGHFPFTTLLWALISGSGMYLLLRKNNLDVILALFASNIFAFNTWFPLHATAGREKYLVFALLPYLLYFLLLTKRKSRQLLLARMGLVFAILILLFAPWTPIEISPPVVGEIKDIFLDPNQIPTADKFGNDLASWSHFGSYIGIIPGILALVGLIISGHSKWPITLIGIVGVVIAITPPVTYRLINIPFIQPQHLIILTTFTLSFFAGFGLQNLQNYLKKYRITPVIIFLITFLVLLDLWQVSAKVIESKIINP